MLKKEMSHNDQFATTGGCGAASPLPPPLAGAIQPALTALPRSSRLDSLDILRGLVMVLMALDHVRYFFTNANFNPTDLTQTSVALFLTRWVTHYCAPVFVFIAGMGAFLSKTRGKTLPDLSRFLWTRGLMLVVFELTIVRFGWSFSFSLDSIGVQVIWALGISMICLAALVRLPVRVAGLFGVAMIVGHNAFDGVRPETFGSLGWLWNVLHVSRPFQITSSFTFMPAYPLIPWIGVMAAGYAFGGVLLQEPARRTRILMTLGASLAAVFILIRALNGYGDMAPWSPQKNASFTVFSFLNTTKYPPSLDYLLMTLGPAIFALGALDKGAGALGRFLVVFGRVPMFFYILHLYMAHSLGVVAGMLQGLSGSKARGFDLPVVYFAWIGVVLAIYPLCKWYGDLKRRRTDAWLTYL